jgi:undecaprenyl-diphosphatase
MTASEGRDAPPSPSFWTRSWSGIRWLVIVAGVGFAIHLIIPQVGELEQASNTIRRGNWWWLAVAVAGSVLTYPASALGIMGSVPQTLRLWTTTLVQLATSATTLAAPAGLGAIGLNQQYLERQGIPRSTAAGGLALNAAVAAVVHVVAMIATAAVLGATLPDTVHLPPRRYLVDAAVIFAILLGAALWTRPIRRRVLRPIVSALAAIPELLSNPTRSLQLFGSALLVNATYIASLQAALAAFGPAPDFGHTALIYLIAALVGTVTPTPGGLGGYEAALVAGLTRIGPTAGQAVAAALTFRLLTFWIPIIPGLIALRVLRARQLT